MNCEFTFSIIENYLSQNNAAKGIEFYTFATENNHRFVPNEHLHTVRIGECMHLCDGQCFRLRILTLIRTGNLIDDNRTIVGNDKVSLGDADTGDGWYVAM